MYSQTTTPFSPQSYRFLTDYIHQESGIVCDESKMYLLETRLQPVLQQAKLADFDALCDALRKPSNTGIRRMVVESMTTHETLFFRDMAPFEALRNHILPPLIEQRRATKKLSFWCAAASSGQEPYSLAMMLLEMGLTDWNIQIYATDLSEKILARAREAKYMQLEVNRGLPATYLVKYFQRAGLEWQLCDRVRNMVRFEPFDLRSSMRTKGPFDFVFCRNVLIYFNVETKKRILRELQGTMFSGGHLLLGSSENTLNLDTTFERVQFDRVGFYRLP